MGADDTIFASVFGARPEDGRKERKMGLNWREQGYPGTKVSSSQPPVLMMWVSCRGAGSGVRADEDLAGAAGHHSPTPTGEPAKSSNMQQLLAERGALNYLPNRKEQSFVGGMVHFYLR